MKKLSFILVLATLALFTQCKKQESGSTETPENGIRMELTANNGSRTSFGPNGAISWSANDKIYVVTNGQCVGHVTNGSGGGSTFTGTLSITGGTYDFHYYYVGNTQTIGNGATSFTMDFSNQDGTLANLGDYHVGYGTQTGVEVTEGETVTAQATMQTLVAMAYFDLAGMAETGEAVYFFGDNINNQLTLDFSTNTPSYSKTNAEGQNLICAGTVADGATSPCYVMLLPNHTDGTEELATDITFISKRTTGTCNNVFNYGIVGGRFYCADGNTETPIALSVASYNTGSLRGEFSVSASQAFRFSQGNLQYTKSSQDWSFMEHQYDMVETEDQEVGDDYADQDVVSLFGWGTSGYNHGAVCYQPWSTSENNEDYYVYGSEPYSLYDQTGQADWGYNAISNGGNTENSGWRTLTDDEWGYVIDTRSTTSGIRYAKAKVNGVSGVILLPNDWTASTYTLNKTNSSGTRYNTNIITAEDWSNVLEVNGALFLPAAGDRYGTLVDGSIGYYWSSSYMGSDSAYNVCFYDSSLDALDASSLYHGYSVRLVHSVE
ncbi:MAG: hypothetical protein IJP44_03385 [Bacteroidales bacterium]|nr:hypothetical protein [Bacteroidales bacterium]